MSKLKNFKIKRINKSESPFKKTLNHEKNDLEKKL
jgi:hypothetical protein